MTFLGIELDGFRVFSHTGMKRIRPLTLLVGENSTGKTSFLAALRFALDLSGFEKAGYFNQYPFDLGTFDEIVNSAENKNRFSVTLRKQVDIAQESTLFIANSENPDIVDATLRVV